MIMESLKLFVTTISFFFTSLFGIAPAQPAPSHQVVHSERVKPALYVAPVSQVVSSTTNDLTTIVSQDTVKRYNTTKFCDLDKVSATSSNGWSGTWYTKDSSYTYKSGITICVNDDKTLSFLILKHGGPILKSVDLVTFVTVVDQNKAEGYLDIERSHEERLSGQGCKVTLNKDVTTIKVKFSGENCVSYFGRNYLLNVGGTYYVGINVATPRPIKDATVNTDQCVATDCKEVYSTEYKEYANKVFVNAKEYEAFKSMVKDDEKEFSRCSDGGIYLVAFNKKTKERVYDCNLGNYESAHLSIGTNNETSALLEAGFNKTTHERNYKYFTNVPGEKEKLPQEFKDFLNKQAYPYDGSVPFKGGIIYMNK